MNGLGLSEQHWFKVLQQFVIDAFVLVAMVGIAVLVRLGPVSANRYLLGTAHAIVVGAFALGSLLYISGLYAPQPHLRRRRIRETILIALSVLVASTAMMLMFYSDFSSRIGRGIMFPAILATFLILVIRHVFIKRQIQHRERIAFLVGGTDPSAETAMTQLLGERFFEFVGVIVTNEIARERAHKSSFTVLGSIADIETIIRQRGITRVVAESTILADQTVRDGVCRLRYSGVMVTTLLNLVEEVLHYVPTALLTPEWLLSAAVQPHLMYMKRIKRFFDVVYAAFGLVLSSPILLVAIALTKILLPGPAFYRQTRLGRFGRTFKVIKLRTMRVDAEKGGAVWARANDDRVTPIGNFLRKYRIDEIPQLWNVLRGEMSLVGPRPERPEFVEDLEKHVPFYRERLLVHPGITGWAQVNYGYGADVEHARRKLEYDLFYLKHLGFFLDIFILLDTVRTVVRGVSWGGEVPDITHEMKRNTTPPTAAMEESVTLPSAPPLHAESAARVQ